MYLFFEMELSSPKIPSTFPGMIDWDSTVNSEKQQSFVLHARERYVALIVSLLSS